MEEEKKITIPVEEYKEMTEICLRHKVLKEYLEKGSRIYRETICAIMGIGAEDEAN